jgi:hypothetical protein
MFFFNNLLQEYYGQNRSEPYWGNGRSTIEGLFLTNPSLKEFGSLFPILFVGKSGWP